MTRRRRPPARSRPRRRSTGHSTHGRASALPAAPAATSRPGGHPPRFRDRPDRPDARRHWRGDGERQLHRSAAVTGMSSIGEECERWLFYQFRFCFPSRRWIRRGRGLSNAGRPPHRGRDGRTPAHGCRASSCIPSIRPAANSSFWRSGRPFPAGTSTGDSRHPCRHRRPGTSGKTRPARKARLNWRRRKPTSAKKAALAKWHLTYYAQAVLYMHYGEMDRHYLTVTGPGGRMPWTSAYQCRA